MESVCLVLSTAWFDRADSNISIHVYDEAPAIRMIESIRSMTKERPKKKITSQSLGPSIIPDIFTVVQLKATAPSISSLWCPEE
jgi:hypothetical protein